MRGVCATRRGALLALCAALSLLMLCCSSPTQEHYSVVNDHNVSSFIAGNYGALHSVTLKDDEVKHLSLPFQFQFFNRLFQDAYLSSNGLLSFEVAPVSSSAPDASSSTPDASSSTANDEVFQNSVDQKSKVKAGSKVIILHRHLKSEDLHVLVHDMRDRHYSEASHLAGFTAHISQSFPHLRMFTTSHLSEDALSYLVNHNHVFHIHDNAPLTLDSTMLKTEMLKSIPRAEADQYSWGLDRIDQENLPLDSSTYSAPTSTYGGRGTSVYVVDTGLDTTHTEFGNAPGSLREVNNIFNYYGAVSSNQDRNGHGTHCAGTVGGLTVGVASNANIYGVQVLDDSGSGDYDSVLAGLDAVLAVRANDLLKPMVVSMSLAGECPSGNCDKDALVYAVEELHINRISVAVAAGNDDENACEYTPGASPYAITIGATTSSDNFASFSNWGSCVDLSAPGRSIVSACSSGTSSCSRSTSMYSTKSGTSMATPHVAGVMALWISQTESAHFALNEAPSTELIKNALQCTSAWDVLTVDSSPNLLLQVPPSTYSSLHNVTCDLDFGCRSQGNISCSGNGQCIAGLCICNSGSSGDYCQVSLPWWEFEAFCCEGKSLSLNEQVGPFNSISFLWTDLEPGLGSVYYGSVRSGSAYMVVFDKVPFVDGSCSSTVEVVLHSDNRFEIIFIYNELGFVCTSRNISIGVKGPYNYTTPPVYEQLSGPSLFAPVHMHSTFVPLFDPDVNLTPVPTIAPTVALTSALTQAPTVSSLSSYNVTKFGYSRSIMRDDYSSLTPYNISTDSYVEVQIPFPFNFFRRHYDSIFISENGRISFSTPEFHTACCDGLGVQRGKNEIAFLWTDLWFSTGGKAYYGSNSNDSVIVVFDKVSPHGYFCSSTLEVQLHSDGRIIIAYIKNSVGFSCGERDVSSGIVNKDRSEFSQLFGPGLRSHPYSETVVYTPLFDVARERRSRSSDDLDDGEISGIAVACVVVVVGVLALSFYIFWKRKNNFKHKPVNGNEDEEVVFSMDMENNIPLSVRTVPIRSQEEEIHVHVN